MHRMFNVASGSLVIVAIFLIGSTAIGGPKLTCEEPLYNFGEREEGESVEHTFIIRNVGDAPADMAKFKPQCGCAVLVAAQGTLAPGSQTGVTLKMPLGNARGPVRKSVAIASEDDKQDALNLTLEGAVTSTLYVLPDRLELGQVDADKEVTRSVVVAFAQEEPVKIRQIMSDVDTMVSDLKTLKEGGIYRVTVRVKPLKGSSRIQARVVLHTDSAKHPMVDIPVIGTVVGDLAATPSEIILAGDPEQPVVRYVVIQSPRGKPFEIKEVQCPTTSVKAEVKPMGATGYRIELSGLTATSDLDGKSVLVKTSICTIPTLQIPLYVRRPVAGQAETQVPIPPGAKPATDGVFRLEEQSVDGGKVRMGKPLEHTFRLFNTSNEMRHILNVTPGCSCAKVIRFSKDVAPQSWGEVAVALDTIGSSGLRQSSVLIETDDPKVPRFNPLLSCQVLPSIEAKPTQLLFIPQGASGFSAQTIEVVGLYQDEKIVLGDIQPSEPMISVTKETIDEHHRIRLNVTVSKDMPAGITLAHLIIPIEGSAQKSMWFPMTIANEAKLKAEPSGLELFVDKNALQVAEFTVKTLDNSRLELNKVELAGTAMKTTPQQTANNAVLVRLEDLKVTHDLDLKHVRVLTNHGELRVPISVRVRPSKDTSIPSPSSPSGGVPKT